MTGCVWATDDRVKSDEFLFYHGFVPFCTTSTHIPAFLCCKLANVMLHSKCLFCLKVREGWQMLWASGGSLSCQLWCSPVAGLLSFLGGVGLRRCTAVVFSQGDVGPSWSLQPSLKLPCEEMWGRHGRYSHLSSYRVKRCGAVMVVTAISRVTV